MIEVTGDSLAEFAAAAESTFSALALSGEAEVEVSFVSEEEIRELNARTRGVDKATDVLSYPMLEKITDFTPKNYPFDTNPISGRVTLGSIVICEAVALRQAAEYGHSPEREKTYLFTHGLLHLLGYDHVEENDCRIMRAAEERILTAIGITR